MVAPYNFIGCEMTLDGAAVQLVREASRSLARHWGFMGGSFAGTDLSPSAVHALIEIEKGGATARDLGARLHLEKSSVSRMLKRLVAAGDVREEAEDGDGRIKRLALTPSGKQRVSAIHVFASSQVTNAFDRLRPPEARVVLEGLQLYSKALGNEPSSMAARPVEIVRGYQTGIVARVTELHVLYYTRETRFGQRFESVVAAGLADLCNRLNNPKNAIWAAMRDGEISGSVSLDSEDMGDGIAHLRCFIVSDAARGTGAGRKLLEAAIKFADDQGFPETHLWTFKGLLAARHLYESFGFKCVEERLGDQWGTEVMEERFVRQRP